MAEDFANNREKYLFHLQEYKKVGGTATEYCKNHDLKPESLSYYKRKIQSKAKAIPQFAKLKIEPSHDFEKLSPAKLIENIDPEWLAKLIHNLAKVK